MKITLQTQYCSATVCISKKRERFRRCVNVSSITVDGKRYCFWHGRQMERKPLTVIGVSG